VLLVFAVLAVANGAVDFSRLFDIEPTEGNSSFLPFGITGILFALPFAIWFFLGIEELPLAAEEATNPSKDIPKASVWGVITLAFFAVLVLFLNPGVTGSAALTESPGLDEPLLVGFREFLPDGVAAVISLFALIGLLASLQGIMYAYGRNMYSLSRAGYYPKALSLTGKKHQTPWVALLVGGAIGFVILLVVNLVGTLVPDIAGAVNGIILFIAVFGAVISYIMQMVSYIVLRRKFPNANRPYKSPTGVPGAVVAGAIAVLAFVGILLAPDFRLAVITFVVIFAVGIAIFAVIGRHRLVLSPEEEYALSGGLHGDPQVEGYDAMEAEVFDTK
jgi:ethanolamine permease